MLSLFSSFTLTSAILLGVHAVLVLKLHSHLSDSLLHLGDIFRGKLILEFFHFRFSVMKNALSLVDGLYSLSVDLVSLSIGLGLLHHVLNFILAKTSAALDDNLLFLASSLVSCVYVDNAVGVNIKGDLNLRDATGCRRDTNQLELSQHLVIPGHFSFSLVHLDFNLSLTVSSSA